MDTRPLHNVVVDFERWVIMQSGKFKGSLSIAVRCCRGSKVTNASPGIRDFEQLSLFGAARVFSSFTVPLGFDTIKSRIGRNI